MKKMVFGCILTFVGMMGIMGLLNAYSTLSLIYGDTFSLIYEVVTVGKVDGIIILLNLLMFVGGIIISIIEFFKSDEI